ncbi:hypothetical protein T03_11654 [Trichinella britovi]|uniref:Uncharacterized protein n=1 Tax=Trichinella britovi TaxID=45882 RepID=A0A0V1C2V1_TRIBR|nr:hypothetical protein T03_11654 [Trichinella britovi]
MSSFFAKLPMKIRHDYARCSAASGVGGTDLRVGVAAVLGLASYYRKFVKGFANVAALLHRLLEKGAEWDCSSSSTGTPAETVLGRLSVGTVRLGEKCSALYGPCASSVHIFTVRDSYCERTVVVRWLARMRKLFYWPWKSVHKEEGPNQEQPCANAAHCCVIPSAASWDGHSWAAGKHTNGELVRPGPDGQLLQMNSRISPSPTWKPIPWPRCWSRTSVVLEMCQLFVIKKTRSFPYHPQGNVQAGQCDDMLPFDMLANNRSDHESPGVTPAIAMLGRESRLPLDVQIRHPPWGEALGLLDYIRET